MPYGWAELGFAKEFKTNTKPFFICINKRGVGLLYSEEDIAENLGPASKLFWDFTLHFIRVMVLVSNVLYFPL